MLDWVLYHIPYQVWFVIGIICGGIFWYFRRDLKGSLIFIGAVVVAVLFHRQRQQGYNDRVKQEERSERELQDEFDKIDRSNSTPSDAYDDLRKRSLRK